MREEENQDQFIGGMKTLGQTGVLVKGGIRRGGGCKSRAGNCGNGGPPLTARGGA